MSELEPMEISKNLYDMLNELDKNELCYYCDDIIYQENKLISLDGRKIEVIK